MYNSILRYSYVYNQRIILEDFSDDFLRKGIWTLTSVLSCALCFLTYHLEMLPDQYLAMQGIRDLPLYRKTEFVASVLTAVSIAINVAFAAALSRHSANLDQESGEEARDKASTMKKILAVLILTIAVLLLRNVADSLKTSPFLMPVLVYNFLNAIMVSYIVNKDPLRKFVKKKFEEKCGIKLTFCSSNSVLPLEGL